MEFSTQIFEIKYVVETFKRKLKCYLLLDKNWSV
jgi:hypothetical protein